jgi:carboxymethylenebutenolidase
VSGSSKRASIEAVPVVVPTGHGPFPAVVLGAEAFGVNPFLAGIQAQLAEHGYASAAPDYYHGHGPSDPESYDSFDEVIEFIGQLDFTCGARDLADCVEQLKADSRIDASRVAVWGYCTGGTLAWLAACQRGDLACAVLYFPSQPTFAEHGPRTPVDPLDLLWQLSCPTLFLYGTEDPVVGPELAAELERRIESWSVPAELRRYDGAGHAFSSPWGPMRHDEADAAAWSDAVAFLEEHC